LQISVVFLIIITKKNDFNQKHSFQKDKRHYFVSVCIGETKKTKQNFAQSRTHPHKAADRNAGDTVLYLVSFGMEFFVFKIPKLVVGVSTN
jgi:hypothetical protein